MLISDGIELATEEIDWLRERMGLSIFPTQDLIVTPTPQTWLEELSDE